MQRDSSSPEAYRADVPPELSRLFDEVRSLIMDVAPDATEGIRYGMLSFGTVCVMAAQKHNVSLYIDPKVMVHFKDRFPKTATGKSCLRIRNLKSVKKEDLRELITAARDAEGDGGC